MRDPTTACFPVSCKPKLAAATVGPKCVGTDRVVWGTASDAESALVNVDRAIDSLEPWTAIAPRGERRYVGAHSIHARRGEARVGSFDGMCEFGVRCTSSRKKRERIKYHRSTRSPRSRWGSFQKEMYAGRDVDSTRCKLDNVRCRCRAV